MSTIIKGYKGKACNQVLLKGAPERVIDRCSKIMNGSNGEVEFTDRSKAAMNEKMLEVASKGYRVLGVGISMTGGNMAHVTADNRNSELRDVSKYAHLEGNCTFVGYVCIKDPVRPEVKPAIAECKMAGVNVIMITGDAKATAISIAKELNILEEGQDVQKSCYTGAEFEALSDAQKRNALKGS